MENENLELDTQEVETQTEEEVKDLLDLINEDEDYIKQFQSEVDRRITKAIETRDKKHQEELRKQERLANMTQEELQAEKIRELEEREQKIQSYELQLKKMEYFKENDIPMELIDVIEVGHEEDIEPKVSNVMKLLNGLVDSRVKEKLKDSGYSTPQDKAPTNSDFNPKIFEGKSIEEINKLWNNYK